jgi:exopolysaccharide biosynthesis polyprenyl glycosylphosphotransferase
LSMDELRPGETFMPNGHQIEELLEFSPVLKGTDARERRFRSSRFALYKIALFFQDALVLCLAFLAGIWFSGLAPVFQEQPNQLVFLFVLAVMVLAFLPTFNLYKYRHIFMKKAHLANVLKALTWGFLSVGVVMAIYRYPHLLETEGALMLVAALGVCFLLLSRYHLAELLHFLKALGLAFVAAGIFGFFAPDENPLIAGHAAVLLWTVFLAFAAVLATRFFMVHQVFSNWFRRHFRRQAAIIGSDEEAKRITEHIVINNAPFWVAGFLGCQGGEAVCLPRSKAALGEISSLPSIVQRKKLDDIIVTDEGIDKKVLISLLDYCTSEGLSVWFSPKLMPIIDVKVYIDSFCGIPMIRLCSQKHEWVFNKLKHGLDALIALPLSVVLLPLFLLISMAIKLDSRGPVFYRARSVGKGGKGFVMYKFRSMRVDTDNAVHKDYVTKLIKGQIRPEGNKSKALKITDDPRITRVGKLLRKTSLDELPQIINVIKGNMSLVGPRPCLPYEFDIYQDWHKKRLTIRPGITGLWQVAGRSAVAFEDMVLLDLYYLYNRSFSMDVSILYETIFAVMGKRGAY